MSSTLSTTYLYGPGGTEEDQLSRGGVALHDLIPGPGGVVGEVVSTGSGTITSTYYYHKDGLGSVSAVSGSSSEVDSYDVWGKRRLTTGGDDTTCSTTSVAARGYITEEHIQGNCPVINLNARLYDPLTTRFLSPDPMGLAAGPNPYAYAANNPITSKDPTGLDCVDYGCGDITYYIPSIFYVECNGGCGGGLDLSGLLDGLSSPPISAPAEDAVQTDQTSDPTPQSDDQTGTGDANPSQGTGCGPGPTVCAAAGGLPAVGVGFLDTEALAAATAAATGTATEAATLSGAVIAAAPLIAAAGVVNAAIINPTSSTDTINDGIFLFYHGTDVDSALSLLNGAPLSLGAAQALTNGAQIGFYLATDPIDAEYFASLQSGVNGATVLQYTMKGSDVNSLIASGSTVGPIPQLARIMQLGWRM